MPLIGGLLVVGAWAGSLFDAGGTELALKDEEGRCQVVEVASGKRHETTIPAPCAVHLGQDRRVRSVQRGEVSYILLEHSRPHPELAGSCITRIQGVSVKGGVVKLSPHADTLASCPPVQWDAKVFTGLFEAASESPR